MKPSHANKLFLWLLIFVASCSQIEAQSGFAYKARLDTIAVSGFYNIALSPGIIAKCKEGLEDVRILDNSNKEVPYILYTESSRPNEDAFTEFPLSYSQNRSEIFINNILPNSISKLFLLIKNSEAQRIAILSGSDDEVHWFIVKENIVLQKEYAANSDVFVQSVSFSPSSYKYFRITMPGKNVLPLNIVKAGVYRQSFSGNVYDSLPSPVIIKKDSSDKRSYVYLLFADSYGIDKLSLFFSGVKYYKRHISVYNKNTINTPLAEDTLFSAKQAGLELHVKTNRLLAVIDNKDNVPLTLATAMAFGLHTSLTAYLEKGRQYTLYFGDSTASAPSYDLQYFDDSIGSNIHPIGVKEIEKIKAAATLTSKVNSGNKWLLWCIIIAVLLLLVYFSLRMIKDMNNKQNNDVHL